MRHLTLTLSLILGLATSVSAEDKPFKVGDVFFCQMDKLVYYDWKANGEKLGVYKNENFRFTISEDRTLRFGESGTLGRLEIPINFLTKRSISANSLNGTANLEGTWFSYASAGYESITMIAATCDRF